MKRLRNWLRPDHISEADAQMIDLLINIVLFLFTGSILGFITQLIPGNINSSYIFGVLSIVAVSGLIAVKSENTALV